MLTQTIALVCFPGSEKGRSLWTRPSEALFILTLTASLTLFWGPVCHFVAFSVVFTPNIEHIKAKSFFAGFIHAVHRTNSVGRCV